MVFPADTAIQKARFFQVDEETMDRADRQAGQPCDFGCRKTAWRLRKKTEQAQTTLDRRDVIGALRGICHIALPPANSNSSESLHSFLKRFEFFDDRIHRV